MKKLIGGLAAAMILGLGCAHERAASSEAGTGGSGQESVKQSGDYSKNSTEAQGENAPPGAAEGDNKVESGGQTYDTQTTEPSMGTSEEDQSSPEASAKQGQGQSGAQAGSQVEVVDQGSSGQATGGSGAEGQSADQAAQPQSTTQDQAVGGSGTEGQSTDQSQVDSRCNDAQTQPAPTTTP